LLTIQHLSAAGVLVPFLGDSIFSWLPFLAAGAMAMSSLTVVSNSLLLGRYKPRFTGKKHDRHEEGILGETHVRPASPKA
jgi:P-type Cu+ transporter